MKMGFTGTQRGMTAKQLREFREMLHYGMPVEFHHGDCIGADEEAHNSVMIHSWPCTIYIHPPCIPSKRAFCQGAVILEPRPYLERNHSIVDHCDVLVAAPKESTEQLRSGTWATVRYARKVGKHVRIIFP